MIIEHSEKIENIPRKNVSDSIAHTHSHSVLLLISFEISNNQDSFQDHIHSSNEDHRMIAVN